MDESRRTLADLNPGESGYVRSVEGTGARRRRIIDMGITPGTELFVVKTAPMGDPLEIALRGYSLSLRREDARIIGLMDSEEARAIKADMALNSRELELKARKELSHMPDEDIKQHEKAAFITEFVLSGNSNGVGSNGGNGAAARGKAEGESHTVRLALIGNPNSGKTTIFNAMTGSREYVGNWPGVTVEKKEGRVKGGALNTMGHDMILVDLPGIYSLSPYSMEEIVARRYITREKPDAIINIVDATNLERNLYLTVQLIELERPMIIALNMMDEVKKRGDEIDVKRLSLELGVPVVPLSAKTGAGVNELIDGVQRLINAVHAQYHEGFNIEPDDIYNGYTHALHHQIGDLVSRYAEKAGLPLHWAEMKLMEKDSEIIKELALPEDIQAQVDKVVERYSASTPLGDSESMIADARYRYIVRICASALKLGKPAGELTVSDKIDAVLTHRVFAIPIFIAIMLGIFALTFGSVGAWLSGLVSVFADGTLNPLVRSAMEDAGAMDWLVSLVCDGVITGVGGVLTFLPQIAILFFCLALLEDSGYISRIAFIMDKPMRRFGLSGRSFIPLLMGFGCTVPASLSARAMENEKYKRMTIMLLPFMSCSAKLPVYGLIAGAFFARGRVFVILSLYVLGMIVGAFSGALFRRVLFPENDAAFMIELPAYHIPTAKNVFIHVKEQVNHFIEKAGTIIFAMSVLLWFLESFDPFFNMTASAENSILGRIGSFIAPVFAPMGFGNWQAAVALLAGIVAKEAVVSSLAMLCGFSLSAGGAAVQNALCGIFTPRSAYAFLIFVLIYPPCMAAMVTMRRELNDRKLTGFVVFYQIAAAYVASLAVYIISGIFF